MVSTKELMDVLSLISLPLLPLLLVSCLLGVQMQLQMVCGGGGGWGGGGAVGSLSRARAGCTLQTPIYEKIIPGAARNTTYTSAQAPPLGTVPVLASSEVKTAQKPGRKDLLGVNTAFPLKIKFCPLMFF